MDWKFFEPKFEYEASLNDSGLHWTGHRNFAYDLVRNLKPKIIVELGTWKGTSFFSFCQGIKDCKGNTKVLAVDNWEGDLHVGKYGTEVFEQVKQIMEKYYSDVDYELLKESFDSAVSKFLDGSIDILHIDGLHTYGGIKHDFNNWISKVSSSGIVLMHDTEVKKENFGVYQFWEELKGRFSTIQFFQSYGLGVLFKNSKIGHEFQKVERDFQMHYSFLHEEKKNCEINRLTQLASSQPDE